MTYKNWTIITSKEQHGIVVDYIDSEGNKYSEPFCFPTYEEASAYGKLCVDRLIRLGTKHGILMHSKSQVQAELSSFEELPVGS